MEHSYKLWIGILLFVCSSVWVQSCIEVWNPILTPSTCLNGTQLLTYEDLNNCNTSMSLPINNGTMQPCTIANPCLTQLCLDPIYENVSCCVVTPTLSCSNYDFLLYNNNGVLLEHGNLTVFNQVDNSYFYNFNRPQGSYYTKICDDSTRQLNVVARNDMINSFDWTLIILFIMTIGSSILGALFNPLFFGISAFFTAFVMVILYSSGYPAVLIGACGLMILVFVILGLFLKKK